MKKLIVLITVFVGCYNAPAPQPAPVQTKIEVDVNRHDRHPDFRPERRRPTPVVPVVPVVPAPPAPQPRNRIELKIEDGGMNLEIEKSSKK